MLNRSLVFLLIATTPVLPKFWLLGGSECVRSSMVILSKRLMYKPNTLRHLQLSAKRPRIERAIYQRLKSLGILKPFRGCRSGKAVKIRQRPSELNIQVDTSSDSQLHSTRPWPINMPNVQEESLWSVSENTSGIRYTQVCSFINSQLNFIELSDLHSPDFECQWFLIKPNRLPRGINSIILGTVYHPPGNDDNKLRAYLFDCLDKAFSNHPNSGIIVLGDFNQFKPRNLCSSFKLKNLVTKAIRGKSILDQAYSTLSPYYSKADILPLLGLSDHSSVLLKPLGVSASFAPTTRINKRDCRPANRRALFSSLSAINWTPLYHLHSCEEQFANFQSTIENEMDIHLALRQVKLHPTDKPWFTPEIKEAITNRQRAWAKGSTALFSFWRNEVTKLCKSARRTFYMVSVNSQETTPKKWWDNIKRLLGQSRSAPLSTFVVSDSVLSGLDLAEVINDSFSKISSDMQPLEYSPVCVDHTPDEFIITPVAVERSLLAVKEGKSPGPDDIPNWLLKDFAPVISRPIVSIFNASIRQGKVPLLWKCAPKPKSVESDLRPISLTAVLSKVLEGFVFSWLCPIVMPHIDPHQFGGIRDSSTLLNLQNTCGKTHHMLSLGVFSPRHRLFTSVGSSRG